MVLLSLAHDGYATSGSTPNHRSKKSIRTWTATDGNNLMKQEQATRHLRLPMNFDLAALSAHRVRWSIYSAYRCNETIYLFA